MNRGPCRPFLVYVHKYISYNPGPSYVPKIIYDMFGPKKGYLYRVWSHEGWDMSQLFSQEGLSILIIITRFDPVRVNEIQYLLDLSTCILFTSEVCLMWILDVCEISLLLHVYEFYEQKKNWSLVLIKVPKVPIIVFHLIITSTHYKMVPIKFPFPFTFALEIRK